VSLHVQTSEQRRNQTTQFDCCYCDNNFAIISHRHFRRFHFRIVACQQPNCRSGLRGVFASCVLSTKTALDVPQTSF
jgi:hypothetical protein